jgi:hypothetical protein
MDTKLNDICYKQLESWDGKNTDEITGKIKTAVTEDVTAAGLEIEKLEVMAAKPAFDLSTDLKKFSDVKEVGKDAFNLI